MIYTFLPTLHIVASPKQWDHNRPAPNLRKIIMYPMYPASQSTTFHIKSSLVRRPSSDRCSPVQGRIVIIRPLLTRLATIWSYLCSMKSWHGYGSIPINTIFSGMNIHLPAILGFTRYQGFDPSPHPQVGSEFSRPGCFAQPFQSLPSHKRQKEVVGQLRICLLPQTTPVCSTLRMRQKKTQSCLWSEAETLQAPNYPPKSVIIDVCKDRWSLDGLDKVGRGFWKSVPLPCLRDISAKLLVHIWQIGCLSNSDSSHHAVGW